MPTDWRSLFEKEYIGSWDIPADRDVTVVIDRVVGGKITGVGGKKSKKPLIFFRNVKHPEKPMCAGATVCKTIARLYNSNNVEDWRGKPIVLFKTQTENSEGTIDCIRVRPYLPGQGPSTAPPSQEGTGGDASGPGDEAP